MVDHRPTLDDVAARAGVGRGTVSRVVNGSARVSGRTRQVVLRAVSELGYVPNGAGRALAGGRVGTVALVLSEEPGRRFEQPYLGRIMKGISSAAGAAQVSLRLTFTQSTADRGAIVDELRASQVDGVLLISLLHQDPLAGLLERRGVPTVLGGRPHEAMRLSYVDVDNRGGSRRAVDYLIGQGRRRIATIAGPPCSTVGVDRLAGYREALDGRLERVDFGDFSEGSGVLAMRRLLDMHADVDAVFVASDNMALGALHELRRQGRRVPDDVAVIGFEDAAFANQSSPTLTTFHQPTEDMGRQMIEMILNQTNGSAASPTQIVYDTDLVRRQSA
jgi:DNA-binding LacI/PurR family transcriptional regulator